MPRLIIGTERMVRGVAQANGLARTDIYQIRTADQLIGWPFVTEVWVAPRPQDLGEREWELIKVAARANAMRLIHKEF